MLRGGRALRGTDLAPCAGIVLALQPRRLIMRRSAHARRRRSRPRRGQARGFVFVRPDGTETLPLVPRHRERSGAARRAPGRAGPEEGRPPRHGGARRRRVRPVVPRRHLRRRRAGADLPAALVQERRRLPRDRRAHRARVGRGDAAHDGGDEAVRRAGAAAGRHAAVRRRPSTSSPRRRPALDVDARARGPRVPPVHVGSTSRPKGVDGHARATSRPTRGVHDRRPAARRLASTRA